MVHADALVDVPHAAAKYAGERLIESLDLPTTILRPNYFFQNDAMVKDAFLGKGLYAMPLVNVGAAMVDIRDIAGIAALELFRRESAADRLPRDLIEISGPEILTANRIASVWTDVLGKPTSYAGDDLDIFEKSKREHVTPAMALDNRHPRVGVCQSLRGLVEEHVHHTGIIKMHTRGMRFCTTDSPSHKFAGAIEVGCSSEPNQCGSPPQHPYKIVGAMLAEPDHASPSRGGD